VCRFHGPGGLFFALPPGLLPGSPAVCRMAPAGCFFGGLLPPFTPAGLFSPRRAVFCAASCNDILKVMLPGLEVVGGLRPSGSVRATWPLQGPGTARPSRSHRTPGSWRRRGQGLWPARIAWFGAESE
jgi:hypothetical protein